MDGCKPVIAVLGQLFTQNDWVENQAGEKRMGCDCTPPQITVAGNTGRTRIFKSLDVSLFRWVAVSVVSEREGL